MEELSELAVKYQIGLHADCCLGSFLVSLLVVFNMQQSNRAPSTPPPSMYAARTFGGFFL